MTNEPMKLTELVVFLLGLLVHALYDVYVFQESTPCQACNSSQSLKLSL
jgi:hypothetical protein